MKRTALLCFGLLAVEGALGRGVPRFPRSCEVRQEAAATSVVHCQVRAGDTFEFLKDGKGDFLHIRSGSCSGYVPQSCLVAGAVSLRNRRIAALEDHPFAIGVDIVSDFASAAVAYSSGVSAGYAVGGGFHFSWQPDPVWQLSGGLGYRMVSLARTLDGTGSITDPDPITYTQNYSLLTVQADVAYAFPYHPQAVRYFVSGGIEFWIPLSGSQTDSRGGSVSFSALDHPLLVLAGPALAWPFTEEFELQAALRPYYNVLASDGSKLFGVRLGVAVNWRL